MGVHGPATPSLLAVKWPRRAVTPVRCLAQDTPGRPPMLQIIVFAGGFAKVV